MKDKDIYSGVFECTKCGICCEHINLIPQLAEYDIGGGVCRYLTKDRFCAIYTYRPDICNVEKMYQQYFCDKMTKEEYYRLNEEGCKKLKAAYMSEKNLQ